MSRFYVGQRVRVVHSEHFPKLIGQETIVTEPEQLHENFIFGAWLGYGVALDPWFKPRGDSLEPIIPEGMESLEETLALWQPEGIAA